MSNHIGSSNFAYSSFLKDYADIFARNFTDCSKEMVSGSLPEKNLLRIGTELFDILFIQANSATQKESIQNIFKKIIQSTNKAYTILSRTWLLMVKDYTDCLIRRNSELNHLEKFLNRINELSECLSDVYFELSRIPAIIKPEINLDSQEQKELVSIFRRYLEKSDIEDQESELAIHTYYHSIPVELNATVCNVDAQSVTFNVHPYEAVALSSMGMALIKSSMHLNVLKAYTSHVDIKERTATFTHFTQHDHPLERRSCIRVEPKGINKVKILINDDLITGRILDFSEVAAAIYVRNIDTEYLIPGITIDIAVELPSFNDKKPIAINSKGTLSTAHKQKNADAYRIIINWEDDSNIKSKLVQYISQRQSEIMRELKELSVCLQ